MLPAGSFREAQFTDGDEGDREDAYFDDHGGKGRSGIGKSFDQREYQGQAEQRHHYMNTGIDTGFAADQQELDAKSVGGHEKHRDKQ